MPEAEAGPGTAGPCPVCRAGPLRFLLVAGGKGYRRCGACEATLLDPAHWLAPADERAVYLLHENEPDDPRYRRFL
ncbi:MAG: hypothetical protein WD100_14250, partial [Tistlia sp.]